MRTFASSSLIGLGLVLVLVVACGGQQGKAEKPEAEGSPELAEPRFDITITIRHRDEESCEDFRAGLPCLDTSHWRVVAGGLSERKKVEFNLSQKSEVARWIADEGRCRMSQERPELSDCTLLLDAASETPWGLVAKLVISCAGGGVYRISFGCKGEVQEVHLPVDIGLHARSVALGDIKEFLLHVVVKWDRDSRKTTWGIGDERYSDIGRLRAGIEEHLAKLGEDLRCEGTRLACDDSVSFETVLATVKTCCECSLRDIEFEAPGRIVKWGSAFLERGIPLAPELLEEHEDLFEEVEKEPPIIWEDADADHEEVEDIEGYEDEK